DDAKLSDDAFAFLPNPAFENMFPTIKSGHGKVFFFKEKGPHVHQHPIQFLGPLALQIKQLHTFVFHLFCEQPVALIGCQHHALFIDNHKSFSIEIREIENVLRFRDEIGGGGVGVQHKNETRKRGNEAYLFLHFLVSSFCLGILSWSCSPTSKPNSSARPPLISRAYFASACEG